jgi:hypothetical protein
MANEIRTASDTEPVVTNPQQFGKIIAENHILWFKTANNTNLLKTHESLTNQLLINAGQFQNLNDTDRQIALENYHERMKEAEKFLGEGFWQVNPIVTDIKKAA